MRSIQLKIFAVAVFSVLLLNGTFASAETKKASPKLEVKVEAAQIIELEVKLVDGKKSWIPATVSAHPGKIIFRLKNTFAEPHGFNIAKILAAPVVVPANTTIDVAADISKAGTYDLSCQLHPAHVKAVLTVK